MRSICRYESLEEHELGDDASGSGSHGQLPNGGGLTGPELLAELKREVTKQVIAESRQVISAWSALVMSDASRAPKHGPDTSEPHSDRHANL